MAATYAQYGSFVSYLGPRWPLAWNGGSQAFFQSDTNNARYFGVHVPDAAAGPVYASGFGYTETTTSSSPYQSYTLFPGNGEFVPVRYYRDSDGTYRLGLFQVVGTTITNVSNRPYPSQVFTNPGFIRGMVAWRTGEIWLYGNQWTGSSYVVNAYETSTTGDGSGGTILGPLVGGGAVSHAGGSMPGGGTDYLGNVSDALVFSQHLAIQQNTRGIYSRTNSGHIVDGYAYMPSTGTDKAYEGGFFAGDEYHLHVLRRSTISVYDHVADLMCTSVDGTSGWSVAGTWSCPPGTTSLIAGRSGLGKVIAYSSDAGDAHATRAFYDIFGTVEEFDPGDVTASTGRGFVQAVLPDNIGQCDAWLTIDPASTALNGNMHLNTRCPVATSQVKRMHSNFVAS
jgi:hypothetical protein